MTYIVLDYVSRIVYGYRQHYLLLKSSHHSSRTRLFLSHRMHISASKKPVLNKLRALEFGSLLAAPTPEEQRARERLVARITGPEGTIAAHIYMRMNSD